MDWKKWCFDCKRQTFVAFFPQSGETVCTECAIILEEHSIDKTSELCTFFADESRDNDPNGTTGGFLFSHGLCQNRGSNPNRGLAVAWKTITTMSDRLGLVPTIKDRANEIFKRVEDHKSISGRDQDALLAACLYIACQQVDQPRTVKEISSVVDGATKKEIGRAVKYIMKQIGLENGRSVEIGAVHVADYMSPFCSNVVMNNEAVKAAQEAAQKAEEFNIRRSPLPTVAAVIYIITQLTLGDISVANGVSEGMIGNSYKDLHPHISTELV